MKTEVEVEIDPRPAEKNVICKKTHVGMGVFARRKLREGEIIGQVTGEIFDDPDYSTDYCISLEERGSLEPEAPFRYLNHSCEPNALLVEYEFEDPELPAELYVEAIRPIRRGEEIVIDYGWPADHAIRCLCGADTCRGWVVSADELHRVEAEPSA